MRIGELNQQMMIARSFPRADFNSDEADRQHLIAMLEAEKKKWVHVLAKAKRTVKHFDSDPAVQRVCPAAQRDAWTSLTSSSR